jgi:Domain of unknown function (DUF5615)
VLGLDALHPLDIGGCGQPDYSVLRRCIEEDRTLITQNAEDFRRLFGRVDMHPIDRSATLQIFGTVLAFLGEQSNPRDYMFNRVLEVTLEGMIAAYRM